VTTYGERLRRVGPLLRLVTWVNTSLDEPIERRLNIDTVSLPAKVTEATELSPSFSDSEPYHTLPYWLVRRTFKPLTVDTSDVMYDIGCGLGRWVCWYATKPIQKSVGIELREEFVEIAERNARTLNGRIAPIEILAKDAAAVDYSEGTIFFLYNPFGAQTLSAVLARIQESLATRPRQVRIAYINPVHEDVLQDCGWLRCFARRRVPGFTRARTSFWTNES
jgi:SAM-dependent methyltransferase